METTTVTTNQKNQSIRILGETPVVVEGAVNYVKPGQEHIELYKDNVTGKTNFEFEKHIVPIHDVRGHEDEFTLDKQGCQFSTFKTSEDMITSIRNQDNARIIKEYYPQTEEFVKQLTGASRVIMYGHMIRMRSKGAKVPGKAPPATHVHNDKLVTYLSICPIIFTRSLFPRN